MEIVKLAHSSSHPAMSNRLKIYDSNNLADPNPDHPAIILDLLTEHITVRELIRSRVYQEVKDYNARQTEYFQGLVQPTETEQTLNGYRLRTPRKIDGEKQFEKALTAFDTNGFILLINDEQICDLDEEITLTPDSSVTFLKLMPLVGG